MIEIIAATKNKSKFKEIKKILSDLPVNLLSLNDGDWKIPEIIEDGANFKENAVKKACIVAGITGKIVLADDSGLEVDALGGQPGVISARYSGENATDRENNLKLLNEMKNIETERRAAQFRCVVALAKNDKEVETAEGTCQGVIGFKEKGSNGFGYDPLFIFPDYNKTFAELSADVKNKISHRARALEKVKLIIEKMIYASKKQG